MCKFFHGFNFVVVLHDENMKMLNVFTDGVKKAFNWWIGVVTSNDKYQFLTFQIDNLIAGIVFFQVLGYLGQQTI